MKTIIKSLYEYEDLLKSENNSLLEKVLSKQRYINVDYNDWYCIDDIIEIEKTNGFDIENMMFSGFYSQGDGAMFEGWFLLDYQTDIDTIKQYIKDSRIINLLKNGNVQISCSFKHSGHYYHHRSYSYNFEIEILNGKKWSIYDYKNISLKMDNIEEQVTNNYEDICKKIYRQLEDEYDSLISDESVLKTIQANDYTFNENGEIEY